MSSHPVGDEHKAIHPNDDIFVVFPQLPDVDTTRGSKREHDLLPGVRVGGREYRVLAHCEQIAGKSATTLTAVRIILELP